MEEKTGHIAWFEILGSNLESLTAFYTEMFGWPLQRLPDMPYALTAPEWTGMRGGVGQAPQGPGWTTFYVTVPDVAAAIEGATRLGGQLMMPPMTLESGVTVAVVSDPEGHPVGLWSNPR